MTANRAVGQLIGAGLRCGKFKGAREAIRYLLISWDPGVRMLTTNRQGWADEACEAFVLGPDRIIGNPDVILVNAQLPKNNDAYTSLETLESWQQSVAALCVDNRRSSFQHHSAMPIAFCKNFVCEKPHRHDRAQCRAVVQAGWHIVGVQQVRDEFVTVFQDMSKCFRALPRK